MSIETLAFRRDELMRFEVKLATQPPLKFVLEADTEKRARCAATTARLAGSSTLRDSAQLAPVDLSAAVLPQEGVRLREVSTPHKRNRRTSGG